MEMLLSCISTKSDGPSDASMASYRCIPIGFRGHDIMRCNVSESVSWSVSEGKDDL